jgi:hypothetical protein
LFAAMRRALVLLLASLAALLALSPTASAAERSLRQAQFELHADGFVVSVRSEIDGEELALTLYRRGEVAYYQAAAEITDETVKARFGRLGELAYTFTPASGAGTCAESEEGTFHGTFTFTGENEYVHFEADHAHGAFLRALPKGCKQPQGPRIPAPSIGRASGPRHPSGAAKKAKGPKEPKEATLLVTSRRLPIRYLLVFDGVTNKGTKVLISAFQAEKLEGMEIERGAQVLAGPGAFRWDLTTGTARIDPPAPFRGGAALVRRPDGHHLWRGSLTVPVLGAKPTRLVGAGFEAKLTEGSPLD